jgi:LacI family transcriptional regulator
MDYRRNAVAGNLRLSQTSLWAVIISDVANPFFTAVVRGVEDVAQEVGYRVVLCNSDEDPAKEAEYLRVAEAELMAGIIIAPARSRSLRSGPLARLDIPIVTIDRELSGMAADSVTVDNREGSRTAVRHLLDEGYRRIACITGPARVSTATKRLEGYRLAMRGQELDLSLIKRADFREVGGYEAMRQLLMHRPYPDGVFVANNLMTIGALRAIKECGLRVPSDIAVVGFDDTTWAELVEPPLTVVRQPTLELGRSAAELLVERIADPGLTPRRRILQTSLVVRESSTREPHIASTTMAR